MFNTTQSVLSSAECRTCQDPVHQFLDLYASVVEDNICEQEDEEDALGGALRVFGFIQGVHISDRLHC